MASQSTKDLQAARRTVSFNPDALNRLLNEGSRGSEMRARVARIISEDGAFDKSKK
jgi:acyl-CoA oxidase